MVHDVEMPLDQGKAAALFRATCGGGFTRGPNRVEIDETAPLRASTRIARVLLGGNKAVKTRGATPGRSAQDWRDGASLLLLAVLVAAFLIGRAPIVAAAPGLASLYERLGLPVNLRGLDFGTVSMVRDVEGGAAGLVVSGEIVNPGGAPRGLPALRFTLYDGHGREVGGWSAEIDHAPLSAGEAAPFRSRLANPPEAARQLALRFEDAAEGKP